MDLVQKPMPCRWPGTVQWLGRQGVYSNIPLGAELVDAYPLSLWQTINHPFARGVDVQAWSRKGVFPVPVTIPVIFLPRMRRPSVGAMCPITPWTVGQVCDHL